MKVLLSIKPEFVEQIMNGTKKYEYRKRIFKKTVESVVIYATMPVGKIVGEFTIEYIFNDTPEEVWNQTNLFSGITEDFFMNYFSEKEEAFAIKIKEIREYITPIEPQEVFDSFFAPQSYRYIDDKELLQLGQIS